MSSHFVNLTRCYHQPFITLLTLVVQTDEREERTVDSGGGMGDFLFSIIYCWFDCGTSPLLTVGLTLMLAARSLIWK